MKKCDFVCQLAEALDYTQKETNRVIEEFIALVAKTIKNGDEVMLPELGKFAVKHKPAREARNPLTGKTVKVPAKVVPQFKASKKFKDTVVA